MAEKGNGQRIKLRITGNPIKLDATITEMEKDGSKIRVRFDGPLDDMYLYKWSENILISRKLADGESPAQFKEKDCLLFEVL